jgi:hypothetical protein
MIAENYEMFDHEYVGIPIDPVCLMLSQETSYVSEEASQKNFLWVSAMDLGSGSFLRGAGCEGKRRS